MRRFWTIIGRTAFWGLWPALVIYSRIRPCTRVFITAGNKVLLVKKWLGDGRWSLSGGGVHGGESALIAAQREVLEETGIKVAASQLKPIGTFVYHLRGLRFSCKAFVVPLGKPLPVKAPRFELTDVQWVPRRELTDKTAGSDVLRLLKVWRQR